MTARNSSAHHGRLRAGLALAAVLAITTAGPVLAQGWSWPWEDPPPRERPEPREPEYRPRPDEPRDESPPSSYDQRGESAGRTGRRDICFQLEQRLVQESQGGAKSRDLLPNIEAEVRLADRTYRSAQGELERRDCYEYFLFSKTLRRSRQCNDLASEAEEARRRLAELQGQRQEIAASGGRTYQDEIIRELARQGCGSNYAQEARKRDRGPFSSFWQDEEDGGRGGANSYGALPFATYRTLCVRLCDGYYFPVSFSTLPNHFERDSDACQSKCAAPAELYYHQNPGGSVDQMVAIRSQALYTDLKTAFRYRKEYVNGCSCKAAEYVPKTDAPAGGAPADAPAGDDAPGDGPVDKRAEAPPSPAER